MLLFNLLKGNVFYQVTNYMYELNNNRGQNTLVKRMFPHYTVVVFSESTWILTNPTTS